MSTTSSPPWFPPLIVNYPRVTHLFRPLPTIKMTKSFNGTYEPKLQLPKQSILRKSSNPYQYRAPPVKIYSTGISTREYSTGRKTIKLPQPLRQDSLRVLSETSRDQAARDNWEGHDDANSSVSKVEIPLSSSGTNETPISGDRLPDVMEPVIRSTLAASVSNIEPTVPPFLQSTSRSATSGLFSESHPSSTKSEQPKDLDLPTTGPPRSPPLPPTVRITEDGDYEFLHIGNKGLGMKYFISLPILEPVSTSFAKDLARAIGSNSRISTIINNIEPALLQDFRWYDRDQTRIEERKRNTAPLRKQIADIKYNARRLQWELEEVRAMLEKIQVVREQARACRVMEETIFESTKEDDTWKHTIPFHVAVFGGLDARENNLVL